MVELWLLKSTIIIVKHTEKWFIVYVGGVIAISIIIRWVKSIKLLLATIKIIKKLS